MDKNLSATLLTRSGIIRTGFVASSFLLLLSCSKLDKDSNCLNDKAACFKEDKTRPQYVQSVLPAPNTLVSTLPEIQLQFSEELNNPQPSDFTFTGGDLSMAITSVTKIDTYTYSLRTNHNPVVGGPLTLSFQNLKDYNGNKIANGTAAFTINLNIPITIDSASHYGISGIALLPPAVPGVPNLGASPAGYQTINVSWHYSYSPVNAGNTVYTLRRSSAVDCSSGTPLTPVGMPAPNPAVGSAVQTYDNTNATTITNTTYTFTLNKNDIPMGQQYILICLTNAANNKSGVQFIDVTHDNIVPTMTLSPMSGIFASAKQLTFSCADNFDRIAYGVDIKTDGSAPSAASITDPAFDPVTGALTSGTVVTSNPFTIQTPYSSDPTKSVFKYRCIDTAGNPSVVYTSGVFDINSAYPTVNLISVTKTGVTPVVAITGIGTGGYASATLTWNTNQAGAAFEVRVDGSACNSGGTPLDSGAAGVTGTPSPAFTNKTAVITPSTTGLALGLNTVRVCVFGAGVWAEDSFPLLLDNSPPTLAVNVPPASYGTSQSLVFTCSDNQDKVAFTQTSSDANATPATPLDPVISVDGAINPTELFSTPLSITTDTTGLKGKKTTIKWRCIDKAGHITAVNSATYTIDSLLPTITVQNQDYLAISTVAGAYQAAQITWVSDRSDLAYQLRRDSTNCLDGFPLTSGANLSAGIGVLVAGTPVTSIINSNTTNFPAGDAPHTVQICVTNYANNIGYTTRSLTLDSTPPTLPIQTPTITQVDATNFTVSWNASSDANGIAGYRIFRRLGASAYGASPDYTAISTSATIAMPDTQPYFLKIVPFDVAGNVPAAGASYTEITTKPAITLVVTGLGSAKFFNLTDGTSSATISANTAGSPWTTSLGTGGTYNFAVTTQPVGQVCAVKELQFGALDSSKTFNINCADGYMVGGTFQTQSAAALNYDLYRGNTSLVADAGTTGMPGFNPGGIAFTSAGTMFVSDSGNSRILRVTSSGTATVLAGSGTAGTVDGLGVAAQFYSPSYMASDGTNLYVSQVGATITTTNNGDAIRKIDSTGNVTTLVSGAQAIDPEGITISGHLLYWANRSSHQIKSLNLTSGVITVIAGSGVAASTDGTGTGATFNQPMALVELKGKLYVTEFGAHKIRVIDIATQNVNTLGGGVAGFSDGAINLANFNGPSGIATDGFDLYVADYYGRRIRRIRLDRTGGNNHLVSTLAGSGASASGNTGTGAAATFVAPVGIATNGRQFFISDEADNRVRKMTDAGLVGYWSIDPGVNPNDYSSSGAVIGNGTVSGGSLGTTVDRFGTTNAASTLNGTSQYITVADSAQLDLTAEYSISVWINPNATASNRIVDKTTAGGCDGYMIDIMSNRLRFLYCSLGGAGAGNVLVGGATVETGKWTHVTATFSNSARKARLYYNGHLDAEFTTGGAVTPVNALPVRIGVDSSTAGNFFSGAISDVRIYDRALSEGEINELAQDALASQVGNSFNNAAIGLLAHYTLANSAAAQGPVGGSLSPAGTGASPILGNDGTANGANYYDGGGYHYSNAPAGLPLGNAPRTHCGWVRPANLIATGQYFTLLQYGLNGLNQKAGLWLRDNAGVKKLVNGGGSNDHEATFNFPINAWTHVCNTYDGTNSSLYANGRLLDTASFPAWNTQSGSLGIGRDLPTAGFLTGGLQDIRIYNNALSATQIRQLATQVPAGLAARYDMVDAPSGGTVTDVSGSGVTGTVTATATHSSDRFLHTNQSYLLNGTSQHIMATGPATTNTDRATLAAWVRWGGTTGAAQVILNNGETSLQGYSIFVDSSASDRIRILCGQVGFADTGTAMYLPVNVWTHLAVVRDATPAWTLYVNGAAVSVPTPCTPNAITGTSRLSVGANAVSAQSFKGDIDDVRVYHRALTAAEVRALAGYHPMQVSSWSSNVATSSLKFFLQPESATYAAGGCAGGANCVSAWNDTSGNNFNVAQPSAGSRPVYDPIGISSRPAIKFVQASKTFLSGTCAAALNSANNTIFSVFNEGNQSGNNGIFQNGAPLTGKLLYFINPLPSLGRTPGLFDLAYNLGAGRLNLKANATFNNSAETVLMALDFDGAAGNMYKNGSATTVPVTSLASSSYNCGAGTLDIGRYYWGPVPAQNPLNADNFDGFIGDFIYFDQVLSPADRLSVNCYLSSKYNLPLSGVTCP